MAKRQRLYAGEMTHRVDVVAPVGVLDEVNPVDVVTDMPVRIDTLPPAFQPAESFSAGGLNTHVKYNVATHYRTDMRLSYVLQERCCTERTFQIVAIIPGDRRDMLEMTCVTNG